MDISSIVSSSLLLSNLNQTSQTSSAFKAADLLAPATTRISDQIESTKVQLSAYGQIKSAFGTTQTAATGLGSAVKSNTATSAGIEKAAQAFVNAYNQAISTVSSAVGKAGADTGALAADMRAQFAQNDLMGSLTSGTTVADLKQAGITQSKSGTLTLDVKVLEQALQSNPTGVKGTLATLGKQVETTTANELGKTGNVGARVSGLTTREQALTSQQANLEQQAASLQSVLDQQNNLFTSYATSSYISAYKNLLG